MGAHARQQAVSLDLQAYAAGTCTGASPHWRPGIFIKGRVGRHARVLLALRRGRLTQALTLLKCRICTTECLPMTALLPLHVRQYH